MSVSPCTKANAAAAYAMTSDLVKPHALAAAQALKVGPAWCCPPRHRHAVDTLVSSPDIARHVIHTQLKPSFL
jgi:hypothetical protein